VVSGADVSAVEDGDGDFAMHKIECRGRLRVRRLVFHDNFSIGLIAEAENLTNRFNANCSIAGCTGEVVNVATASDLGRFTSVRPPRRFQFGGRFTF
jgi:hypothetical protein